MDNSAVIITTSESSPKIKAHIDRVVVAQVAVSDDTSTRDAVLGDGNLLAAESVVLSRAVLVKEPSGHSDKGGVGVYSFKVGADAASTVLAQNAVTLIGVAVAVDGAVGVIAVDATATGRRTVGAAAAVFGAGTAVAVLRATLAGGARSTSITAVTTSRWWVRTTAVLGTSTAVAVFGAALARGAVGTAGTFAVSLEQSGRSCGNSRSHGQEESESRLLHCEAWVFEKWARFECISEVL